MGYVNSAGHFVAAEDGFDEIYGGSPKDDLAQDDSTRIKALERRIHSLEVAREPTKAALDISRTLEKARQQMRYLSMNSAVMTESVVEGVVRDLIGVATQQQLLIANLHHDLAEARTQINMLVALLPEA